MKKLRLIGLFFAIAVSCGIFGINAFCLDSSGAVRSPQTFAVSERLITPSALNKDGYNYIKPDELAKLLDIGVSYNEVTAAYSFDKAEAFGGVRTINADNPFYTVTDGFSPFYSADAKEFTGAFAVEYIKTETGVAVADCGGDFRAVSLSLADGAVWVRLAHGVNDTSGIFAEMYALAATVNGRPGAGEGNAAGSEIADLYRVYVNGAQVSGRLSVISAGGDTSYRLSFGTPYLTGAGDTLRIELGRKTGGFADGAGQPAAGSQNISVDGLLMAAGALDYGGQTYVKLADFAQLLDIGISFNEITGMVELDKAKTFGGVRIINAENPYYTVKDGEQLYDHILGDFYDGFTLEFVKTEEGLAVVDRTGDYKVIYVSFYPVENYTPYVFVQVYQNVTDYSGIFGDLYSLLPNTGGSMLVSEDSDAVRSEIAKLFRVYINGRQVFGDLSSAPGNGSRRYQLSFDTPVLQNIGDTLRIELGRR